MPSHPDGNARKVIGKSSDPENGIPTPDGKVILVVGVSASLGKETILQLAKHHRKENFLAARAQLKADHAIQKIKKAVHKSNISYIKLGFTLFTSLKEGAEQFKSRPGRLEILIDNACDYSYTRSQVQD